MGVEPTTLAAKDRIAGFEGREDHRTLFASAGNYRVAERTVSTWRGVQKQPGVKQKMAR